VTVLEVLKGEAVLDGLRMCPYQQGPSLMEVMMEWETLNAGVPDW